MENKNEQKGEAFSSPEREFENKPIVETQLGLSKDKKYVIHRTIITDIKPVKYWEKVMESKE